MNISSLVVHAAPGHVAAVQQRLLEVPGVDIHGASDEGKFVVTIEASDDTSTVQTFERINALEGVLSASMVFHQFEPDPEKET